MIHPNTPIIFGFDFASRSDVTAEAIYRVLPDGRFEVVSVHHYSRTIDLGTAEYVVEPRHHDRKGQR